MTDDQRFASRRPDVMVYQTDILDEDITLTGPLTADLFVSTTGTDADYVVKLIDVFPADAKADLSGRHQSSTGRISDACKRRGLQGKIP